MKQRVYLGTYIRGFRGRGLEERPFPDGVVMDAVVGTDPEEVMRSCWAKCYGPRVCIVQTLDLVGIPVTVEFPSSGRVGWNVSECYVCSPTGKAPLADKLRWDVRLLLSAYQANP